MKPLLRLSSARRLSHYDRTSPDRRTLPLVDYNFQPRRFGDSFGGGDWPRRHGFNALAREVMRTGAGRSFLLEGAVLGLIALVTAWPIAMMIREVIRVLQW